jgi:uncharacterized protein (DUF885 family)
MIGKLKIMEPRAQAQKALGEKFDIRGFNNEILKDGPVPLNILQSKLENWVTTKK